MQDQIKVIQNLRYEKTNKKQLYHSIAQQNSKNLIRRQPVML